MHHYALCLLSAHTLTITTACCADLLLPATFATFTALTRSLFPRQNSSHTCPLVSNISIYALVTCVVLAGEKSSFIYLDHICVQPLCFSSVCPGPFPWRTWLLTFQATWQEKLLPFFFCWISMIYRFCTPFFLCHLLLLQLSDFSVSLYFSSLLILFCIYYRLYSVVSMELTKHICYGLGLKCSTRACLTEHLFGLWVLLF